MAAGGEGLRVDDPVAGEVLLDGLHQVAALAGEAGGGLGLAGYGELGRRPFPGVEPALLDHAVKDVVPAVQGGGLVVGVGDDVVLAGRVQQGGEVRALGGGEVLDVLAVVRLGGGLDAVRVAPEVAGVEVALEDLVLALLAVELDGDEELLGLADDGPLLAEVVVLDVLLGDGGAALLALAGRGVPAGPEHGLHVDGGLGVEVAVLGGQHGLLDGPGHLGELDLLPVHLAVAGQDAAVLVEVDVGLRVGSGVGGRDADELVAGEEPAAEQEGGDQDGPEEHPPGGEEAAPTGPLGRFVRPFLPGAFPCAPCAPSSSPGLAEAAEGSRGAQCCGSSLMSVGAPRVRSVLP
ncbi:hypothetical protein SMICM17S_05867 [Streptomyces microflavus]